ncbi:hypothetical protein GCM10022293_00840 [Azospirillum formosense]
MLKHPPLQDVIELFAELDPAGDLERLKGWHSRPPASWNYQIAHSLVPRMAEGVSKEQIAAACAAKGAPSGRRPNADAALTAYQLLAGRSTNRCPRVPVSKYNLRKDIQISISPIHLIIEKSHPRFAVLNPRKGLVLSEGQISIWMKILKDSCAREGYENYPFEIIDVSAPNRKTRVARIWRSDGLQEASDGILTSVFQRYANTFDILVQSGFKVPDRPTRHPPAPPPNPFGF